MNKLLILSVLFLFNMPIHAEQSFVLKFSDKGNSVKPSQLANDLRKTFGSKFKFVKAKKDMSSVIFNVEPKLSSIQQEALIAELQRRDISVRFLKPNLATVIDLRPKMSRTVIKLKKDKSSKSATKVQ